MNRKQLAEGCKNGRVRAWLRRNPLKLSLGMASNRRQSIKMSKVYAIVSIDEPDPFPEREKYLFRPFFPFVQPISLFPRL